MHTLRMFAAGQKHETKWGGFPVMVEILKRTAQSVKIHVTAPPLTDPEGEAFTRRLLVNEDGESFYPLGSYICGAPQLWLLSERRENRPKWDRYITSLNTEGSN